MSLGQKIYQLRSAQKLSQGDLANQLDVSRQSVSKWETDSATPDLDKLMKMCDIFEVSLDELVGRCNKNQAPAETHPSPVSPFTTQKIVGYILLTVSLFGWILLAIFADPIIAILLAQPMLNCAIVCLTVKQRAGYYCIWVVWFVYDLLVFYIMGIGYAVVFVCRILLYTILFFITLRVFRNVPLLRKRKGLLLSAWIIYPILHVLPTLIFHLFPVIPTPGIIASSLILSAIPTIFTPFLFIYTARYLNHQRENKIS